MGAGRMQEEGEDEDDGDDGDGYPEDRRRRRGGGLETAFVKSNSPPVNADRKREVLVSIPQPREPTVADPFAKPVPAAKGKTSVAAPAAGAAAAAAASGAGTAGAPAYSMFTATSTKQKKDKEFGKWEQHTKGIGMKLLMKMGFQPDKGLGVAGQGIVRPIEVKVREKGQALQEEGERTQQSRKDFPTEADRVKAEKAAKAQWRVEPGQRRRKLKYSYKTAEELAADGALRTSAATPAQKTKIIDMTGAQTRVLDSYDALRAGTHMPALAAVDSRVPMPELQHNIAQLVEMAAGDIQRVSARLRRERASTSGLTFDGKELREKVQKEAKTITNLREIIGVLGPCASNDNLLQQQCESIFNVLQNHYPEEYRMYGLASLAPALVFPVVKRALATWDPLADPDACVKIIITWQPLLTSADELSAVSAERTMDAYEQLLWDYVAPPMRTALSSTWLVRTPGPAIALLLTLRPHVPGWLLGYFCTQVVLPRLSREVEAWDPRRDPVPVYSWLQPWAPLLGPDLASLYPPVRFKLASCLQAWQPSDPSALAMIKPWRTVWSQTDLAVFLSRNIVPKLTQAVKDMSIDPRRPQLDALGWVAAWRPMLTLSDVVAIFEGGFCNRFLNTLGEWLQSPTANFVDIALWYEQWKGQFDAELLAQAPMRGCFNRALDLMEQAMDGVGPSTATPGDHASGAGSPRSNRTDDDGPLRAGPVRPPHPLSRRAAEARTIPATSAIGVKDLVQHAADSIGVVFAPRGGVGPEGKALYSFGKAVIYIDRSVVFAKRPEGFVPVSLDDLPTLAL
jgi:tuftelin-interacting protein 11